MNIDMGGGFSDEIDNIKSFDEKISTEVFNELDIFGAGVIYVAKYKFRVSAYWEAELDDITNTKSDKFRYHVVPSEWSSVYTIPPFKKEDYHSAQIVCKLKLDQKNILNWIEHKFKKRITFSIPAFITKEDSAALCLKYKYSADFVAATSYGSRIDSDSMIIFKPTDKSDSVIYTSHNESEPIFKPREQPEPIPLD